MYSHLAQYPALIRRRASPEHPVQWRANYSSSLFLLCFVRGAGAFVADDRQVNPCLTNLWQGALQIRVEVRITSQMLQPLVKS